MAVHVPEGDHRSRIEPKSINSSSTSNTKIRIDGNRFTQNQNKIRNHVHNEHILSPMEETYTSLIQQYLSLLCFENAAFLAERMVAECSTEHSAYLLATCYYRMGHVKSAYSILMGHGQSKVDFLSHSQSYSCAAARFLLAKCCIDLGLLKEAEDSLLPSVQERFSQMGSRYTRKKKGGGAHNSKDDDLFSEWILSEPCPVPNGAAGLHLLGLICQKSHRRRQAAKYFSLSLKLDPMMWTSFQALCEMGCIDSSSKSDYVDMDPVSIFGVKPTLYQPSDPQNHGSHPNKLDQFPYPGDTINGPLLGFENTLVHNEGNFIIPNVGGSSSERAQTRDEPQTNVTPPTAASLNLSFQTPVHPSIERTHSKSKSGLSSRKYSLPVASTLFPDNPDPDFTLTGAQNISAIPEIRSGRTKPNVSHNQIGENTNFNDHLNNSSPMFGTPNLTPIKYNGPNTSSYHSEYKNPEESARARLFDNDSSYVKQKSTRFSQAHANNSAIANIASMAPPKSNSFRSSIKTNPLVMTQARKVVARLYYEPSPETYSPIPRQRWSPSFHTNGREICDQNELKMNLNLSQSHLSFSNDIGTTGLSKNKSELLSAKSSGGILGGLGGSTTKRRPESIDKKNIAFTSNNVKKLSSKLDEARTMNGIDPYSVDDDCIQKILSLLCTLGASYKSLCQYQCQSALNIFHTLPPSQYHTGWVQHQVGKAYFEMADYHSAKHSLELMQSLEPHRMKGLELLSTALWHLKKEVDLCNLAQRVVDFDRLCPESWCVIGNCFSLQKEHDTALQFFKRSIQLDPTFTYSHTLSGHEYVSNEDFDRAAKCYRDAIREDERHYNAWYGLGAIYFRQEKYDLAEYHFRRALSINPQSSILHCHLGMAQYANNKPYEALDTLHGAFQLDPRNAQARYQRATIYMSLNQPREALEELERVRDAAPREASVHFAMGKVCKRLGWPERAMRCFLTALDLDPKDNNLIKAAMDRLNDVDVEEDVSAF